MIDRAEYTAGLPTYKLQDLNPVRTALAVYSHPSLAISASSNLPGKNQVNCLSVLSTVVNVDELSRSASSYASLILPSIFDCDFDRCTRYK
jgi:hypothetical protein